MIDSKTYRNFLSCMLEIKQLTLATLKFEFLLKKIKN